jgi:hypothetical protein
MVDAKLETLVLSADMHSGRWFTSLASDASDGQKRRLRLRGCDLVGILETKLENVCKKAMIRQSGRWMK